mgnify:CR=1 FL=1
MVLANPEIALLPNWVIALVAAGGLAAGALRAAAWLGERPPGLYGMRDVLGLAAAPMTPGSPWLMYPGTAGAHVMISPPSVSPGG